MPEDIFLTLKLTADVIEVVNSHQVTAKRESKPPSEADVAVPRWSHWYQRKLARVWYATLLGMNIEPTVRARNALKVFDPDRFQIYEDRLDVAKALVGHDLPYYEDHLREGNVVGEKYVALADYFEFANNLGWSGLEPMRDGLQIDTNPSKPQEMRQNQKNNLLVLLHELLLMNASNFDVKKPNETAGAVIKWFAENKLRMPVESRTLQSFISEIPDAIESFDQRALRNLDRIDLDRIKADS